jgi:hypothetical protein
MSEYVIGREIIEAALKRALASKHEDAPFGLDHDEAAIWHQAQASAYQHALEMMPAAPTPPAGEAVTSEALSWLRAALDCKDWHWDPDQREAAEFAYQAAAAAPREPAPAVGDGMLPDALVPHAKEWYRLCERRFAVDRMTISGELAEAIVLVVGATPPASHVDAELQRDRVIGELEQWFDVDGVDLTAAADSLLAAIQNRADATGGNGNG